MALFSDSVLDEPQPGLLEKRERLDVAERRVFPSAFMIDVCERTEYMTDDPFSRDAHLEVPPVCRVLCNIYTTNKRHGLVHNKDLTVGAPKPITEQQHLCSRRPQSVKQCRCYPKAPECIKNDNDPHPLSGLSFKQGEKVISHTVMLEDIHFEIDAFPCGVDRCEHASPGLFRCCIETVAHNKVIPRNHAAQPSTKARRFPHYATRRRGKGKAT